MNTVKQNTDLILTSLAALATAEAIAALSNNVQTLSNKIDAITTQHATDTTPALAAIADAVGATTPTN